MGVEVILSLQPLSPTNHPSSRHGSLSSCTLRLGLLLSRTHSLNLFHRDLPPRSPASVSASASSHAFSNPNHNPGGDPDSQKLLQNFLDREVLPRHDEQRWRNRDQSAINSDSSLEGCRVEVQNRDSRSRPRSGQRQGKINGINLEQGSSAAYATSSGLPFSLRMLKRKQKSNRPNNEQGVSKSPKSSFISGVNQIGSSLVNAFSSMVFMVRTLQSHTLQIHQQFCQRDIEGLLNQVHREMHSSFLWLFQQVFSCTPQLMVLIMILLADFTVFSMSNNLPMSISMSELLHNPGVVWAQPATTLTSFRSDFYESPRASSSSSPSPSLDIDTACQHGDGGWIGTGGGGGRISGPRIAGGADGDPDSKFPLNMNTAPSARYRYTADDKFPKDLTSPMVTSSITPKDAARLASTSNPQSSSEENISVLSGSDMSASMAAAAHAFDELCSVEFDDSDEKATVLALSKDVTSSTSTNHVTLDRETMKRFVAPFTVRAEDDDSYSCYDRTDLSYQYAISKDSTNTMLLANYAQFLFLVRKDHDRAEELFRRAVQSDPTDGNSIARFASFLWLARHNLQGAEKAYRAAISSDPGNSYYAANYAHFLWTSGH